MSLAEVIRAVESKKRVMKFEAQQKAYFDYTLADLIGRSVARIHSSANQLPHISQAYPSLFDNTIVEEQLQEKKNQLSVLRLKQFAASFNARFKEAKHEE